MSDPTALREALDAITAARARLLEKPRDPVHEGVDIGLELAIGIVQASIRHAEDRIALAAVRRMDELATAQDDRRLTAAERREQADLVDRLRADYARYTHAIDVDAVSTQAKEEAPCGVQRLA